MKRKIEWLNKMIEHYSKLLDHAKSADEINLALRMKRAYEQALMDLEEE